MVVASVSTGSLGGETTAVVSVLGQVDLLERGSLSNSKDSCVGKLRHLAFVVNEKSDTRLER
jgi:hypothetical protein